MEWILKLVFLGIVIGIVRKYPKISIVLAVIGLLLYCQKEDPIPQQRTAPTEIYSNKTYSTPEVPTHYRSKASLKSIQTELGISQPVTTKPYEKPKATSIRVGATCKDGTSSKATGRGACSHHGGVAYWLYE
ncbi:hypothetical protein Celal_0839 [Cellulophaga algicola DSM 14237]|uniref:DUF3761 domain-containing protein n=1 Tax=Cellulophaga algicola (strain DSM 14237 / IC166 / ACAM 630) TaxID=688270 RepID=E6XEW6_CELAD|nr:DUF3761 domain-containing protein [Cellulophaga algicola]ADV48168.1 hypothetical protein Celal_0839 [Cellulophaga algicola DSM 14237]